MNRFLAVSALFSVLAFSAVAASPAYTGHDATMRVTPAKIGSAYVTVDNPTAQADFLTGAKADWAERIELHEVTDEGGIMKMQKVDTIALPANGSMVLKSGSYHLMLFGLKQTITPGEKRDITLHFDKAGDVTLPFTVQALSDAHQHHHHDMQH